MAGAAALRLDGPPAEKPDRTFPLRWVWRWRSTQLGKWPNLSASFRLREQEPPRGDDPAVRACAALERSRSLGWRAILAAHEAAWNARWTASDIVIEGDAVMQKALRFAVYHLTSAANPGDDHVSIGARRLTGDAYFGHVFWDTERSTCCRSTLRSGRKRRGRFSCTAFAHCGPRAQRRPRQGTKARFMPGNPPTLVKRRRRSMWSQTTVQSSRF